MGRTCQFQYWATNLGMGLARPAYSPWRLKIQDIHGSDKATFLQNFLNGLKIQSSKVWKEMVQTSGLLRLPVSQLTPISIPFLPDLI